VSNSIDIGHGVTIRFTAHQGETIGIVEEHPDERDPSTRCAAALFWKAMPNDRPRPIWTLVQRDPLTLTPSISCTACGHHGFITDGRWVPA
jgi:hypothetical protein